METSRFPARGEVYWVELDPTVGVEIRKTRPCLVVSSNIGNQRRGTVVVLPISNGPLRDFPLHVVLTASSDGSHVIVDQIRSVDKSRLGEFAGSVSSTDLVQVSRALRKVIALE